MTLPRRTPLERRTRLRARSSKRARIYREERAPLVARLLADNPLCQRCHAAVATDVHEILSRARGGSILDLENLALLCRPCHEWVTTNPREATAAGWLRSRTPATTEPDPEETPEG